MSTITPFLIPVGLGRPVSDYFQSFLLDGIRELPSVRSGEWVPVVVDDGSGDQTGRIAREKGASTIGIANNPRSPLKDASTWFFCTSFPESRVKMAVLSSRLAQLSVLDALYLLATRHREQLWDVAT
jgi:hypothetical protein